MQLLKKETEALPESKILVRNFLTSLDRSLLMQVHFPTLKILNLGLDLSKMISPEETEDSPQTLELTAALSIYKDKLLPIVDFHCIMNQCYSVDTTDLYLSNSSAKESKAAICQIKTAINPSLILVLGNSKTVSKSNALAQRLNYDFLDSKKMSNTFQLESPDYFNDFCLKMVEGLATDTLLIHLDQELLDGQWQTLLLSHKKYAQTVFYEDDSNNAVKSEFFKKFEFQGKLINFNSQHVDLYKKFNEVYPSKLAVYGESFPEQLKSLVDSNKFVSLDLLSVRDVVKKSFMHRQIDLKEASTGN